MIFSATCWRFSSQVLLLAFLLGPAFSISQAAFLDNGVGARPIGMGGAFTAVADDTNASLFNPAGLVQVQWNEISATYARLFTGETFYAGDDQVHLDQSYFAYVSKPLSIGGSFGISWANFNTTHLYREDTVALSYARNVGDLLPVFENALAFGVNVKYLRRGITLDSRTTNDPVFAGGDSASAWTLDAGFLFKPEEGPWTGWRLGLAAQNLTQPDVGFAERDRVPVEYRLGIAYQNRLHPWIVPAIDVTRRARTTGLHAGFESWLFHDVVGLRAGVNRDEGAAGLSYYQALTKKFGFRLDYGFTVPFYIEGTTGSHRLAATVYF